MTSLEFLSNKLSLLGSLIGILVSLFMPLLVPLCMMIVGSWHKNTEEQNVYNLTGEDVHDKRTKNEVRENDESEEVHDVGVREEVHGVREEVGLKLLLKRLDFWLYFFVYLFGATLRLMFLNNLGQIAQSRDYSRTSLLVSLSSSFGFFGRLMPFVIDYFYSKSTYAISKPGYKMVLMAPTAGAIFLLLNKNHFALYISTAIIEVCTGTITSIAVSMTTELLGTKNFSVNHNVVVANIPVGERMKMENAWAWNATGTLTSYGVPFLCHFFGLHSTCSDSQVLLT
ncbi:hypothetical protein V8G54_036992 [Vigna mungo]|uniref:NFD4 C-terminal domain-containing protein n=1 Tax=Vigna mungo TaxID=3915 RepID=A0AAQ3MIN8_VIGMU